MEWTEIIIALISLVLAPVVLMFTKAGIEYLKTKTESVALRDMLTDVNDAVDTAVNAVVQTYTETIKSASADGKLTQEEKKEAMARALAIARNSLNDSTLQFLLNHDYNIKDYLQERLEAALAIRKEG